MTTSGSSLFSRNWQCRNAVFDDSMAMAQPEMPQVKVHPIIAANMVCSQLRALEQAAASAEHCEAICRDMVATAYCRAGMLCDLVASVHRAQEHADSVNAAFLSILQTVEGATDELYRYIMIPSEFRANQMQSVKESLREQQKILHYRFDDLSVYMRYLDLKGFDGRLAPGTPDPVRSLRSNMLSLQQVSLVPNTVVMSLAPASFARKRNGGQYACSEHPELRQVAVSPHEDVFVTYGLQGHLAVWDSSTGRLMHDLKGHSGRVFTASFCAHGNLMATGSQDTTVRLWDVYKGTCRHKLEGHSSPVSSVSWNLGGMLVSRSADSTVKWWDASTGYSLRFSDSEVLTGLWRKTDALNCTVSVKNLRIKAWSVHGMVVAWYCQSESNPDFSVSVVEGLYCRPVPVVLDPADSVTCVASTKWYQNCEFHYCAVGCADNTVRLFYKHCHQNVCRGQGAVLTGHSAEITALAWSPDERFLVSCSADCSVRLWGKVVELMSGLSFVRVFQGHKGSVMCAAWSPDGCKVVTGSTDGTTRLWNVSTGAMENVLQESSGPVTSVAFSGRDVFVASDDGQLRIHRVSLGSF